MKKSVLVLSVGGSVILPDKKNDDFLLQLRATLKKHYRTHKFVLVCGGGSVARAYINVLAKEHKSLKEQSEAGIRATRMNAQLVMQVFGKEANDKLPRDMKSVKSDLAKNNVVVCGALRYAPNQTSDTTAAKLAAYLGSEFVNLTNVPGLYTSDPRIHKTA
jgi:uridylate kinase